MGAHAACRIDDAGAVLDFEAFHGIGIIAGPGLRHIMKNAGIESAAAAGAAFEQYMRELGGNFLHDPVQPQHVAVGCFSLALRRQGGRADLGHMPVHIPFDIGDRCRCQNAANGINDIVAYLRARQIQNQLVAGLAASAVRHMQAPVGMGAVQLAVRRHHLRFEPEAELHAEPSDPFHQIRQALRQLAGIHEPVAQRSGVVIAAAEPAVVKHEQLDAQRLAGTGDIFDFVGIEVEVGSFPVVDQHRAGLVTV
ncbi:hypothetical protein D3C73_788250 [compost metagenome]